MMSDRTKSEQAQRMKKTSPVDYARRSLISAPRWFETLLQFKDFGGGVPLNTETAAVNPWVGI
jgi:hypothetical protein